MHTIRPEISSNGSHPFNLVADLASARSALSDAVDAMGKCCPHGRDYLSGQDWGVDHKEHWRRVGLVIELMDQYEAEARIIHNQGEAHGRASV